VTVAAEMPEGERLPVVGDRETLLKLLKDRGVLYDNSRRVFGGSSQDAVWDDGFVVFDTPVSGMVTATPAPDSSMMNAPAQEPPPRVTTENGDAQGVDLSASTAENDGGSHSQTNEQVEGVSEGDIVKTDGQYIYAMSPYSNTIRIIKADGAKLEVVSTIMNNGVWGSEFYLIGNDRLVIVGSENVRIRAIPSYEGSEPANSSARIAPDPDYYGWHHNDFTVLHIYDISDRTAPEKLRSVSLDGWCVSTRVINDVVYIVTNKQVWAVPYDRADSPAILPYCLDTAVGENHKPIGLDRIYYIPDTTDTSYLLIGAIDVYSDAEFKPEAYLGAGSSLYMSQNAMYVTKSRWEQPAVTGDMAGQWIAGKEMTDILRFAINGTKVQYTGTGTVEGSPINQYSMDEFGGFFRIATTDWEAGSYVTVLNASSMQKTGRTEPLAPGERLQSMRFMGDMGYIVTFLNVDPLFTIDLSDPYKPRVLGELKIPGFSQYLHPVGRGLMLGIGRSTQEIYTRDSNGTERVVGFQDIGMKASLFDVSNPFDPKETDILELGEGATEVSHNPRSMMCDPSRSLYGLIVESYDSRGYWSSSALLIRVKDGQMTIAATLMPSGNVSMYGSRLCFIGNTLYFVHEAGITAYDYNSFMKLGSIAF